VSETLLAMGQKLGKCSITPAAMPFVQLPKRAIDLLWREMNILAEGYSIRADEFMEICACLR